MCVCGGGGGKGGVGVCLSVCMSGVRVRGCER